MLQNFRTYQLALQFYKDCQKIPAPDFIKNQLSRASLSVVLNLAEGSAKPTPKDRKRFYSIALGSFRVASNFGDSQSTNLLLRLTWSSPLQTDPPHGT